MRKVLLAFICLLATLLVSVAQAASTGNDYNLPNLGQPANTALSPSEGKRLGAQIIARLRARGRILDDPELESYIRSVGRRLVRHTDWSPKKLHFYVIDTGQINAFALPGGYIGVNAGLITATDSESELASVMAHEIAHVTQNHIARQIAESRGDAVATLATAIVAGILGASMGGGDAATAAILGGMSHLGMQQLSYTRANEYEADRVGIRDLARSGYDPHAMVKFFGKLQRHADLYGENQIPQILLSHPVTSTRMAEAQARANSYSNITVHTSPEYPYMRTRARVLTHRATVSRDYFRRKTSDDRPAASARYGYALALSSLSQNKKAIALMRTGASKHPGILAWQLGLAHAFEQAGMDSSAEHVLASALKKFPTSSALKLAYAKALENLNEPGKMRNFLLSQTVLLGQYPEAQRLLAQGAGKQKRLGEAYYRLARYYAMLDNYPQAINHLRTALKTADLSSYNKSRLSALRQQMIAACYKAWSEEECRRGVIEDARH